MTTDTEDDGFPTVHQSAAYAGAGAGGVVRPDLPIMLSAAQAEIVALRGRVAELEKALKRSLAAMNGADVFVRSHERVNIPYGEEWWGEELAAARRALTKGGDDE